MVSIQSSHTSPSKCRFSSPFGNLMSCSLLTPWLCSLNYLSCGNVIYGISCVCSFGYLSCGDVIYGIVVVYLTACTIIGTINGSIFPLIIFCALKFVLSCSLFTHELEALPSSPLFFLLKHLFESLLQLSFYYLMLSTFPP